MPDTTESLTTLADRLLAVDATQRDFLREANPLLSSRTQLTNLDYYLLAATKRSLALAEGFVAMIRARNFHAAAPMVRMQLDTALRVAALGLVDDSETLADAVIKGGKVNSFRDRSGAKLTDRRLLEHVAETFPWVRSVYDDASGFIHLSRRHLWTAMEIQDREERTVRFVIHAADPPSVPEERYFGAVDAFTNSLVLARGFVVAALEQRQEDASKG